MFGIEVEFYSNTRATAAKVIKTVLNGKIDNSQRTISCYNKKIVTDQQERKWTITRDSSVFGSEAEKCELATPPLTETDLPLF